MDCLFAAGSILIEVGGFFSATQKPQVHLSVCLPALPAFRRMVLTMTLLGAARQ